MSDATDYGCPDCGYDGPHSIMEEGPEESTVECGACFREFKIVLVQPDADQAAEGKQR